MAWPNGCWRRPARRRDRCAGTARSASGTRSRRALPERPRSVARLEAAPRRPVGARRSRETAGAATRPPPATMLQAPLRRSFQRIRLVLAARPKLRRHVVLVMLGEDFGGEEASVRLEAAFGDDAAILAEQIGGDSGE